MPNPFSRTLRSLESDGHRRWILGLVPALLLLAAWSAWFFGTRVAVYEVSDRARIEAEREAHPVQAPVDGRVAALHWRLGQEVAAGDVLVELEGGEQKYLLQEEQARGAALGGQIEALRRQIASVRKALEDGRAASRAAIAESAARSAEAAAAADLAETEARRLQKLREAGLVPEADWARAHSQAEQRRAAARALAVANQRAGFDARSGESDRQAKLDELERDLALLEGQSATAGATGRRLGRDLDLRLVRAPVAGRVGEIAAPVRVGSVVAEGDRLGVVVPDGGLRVVADFPPDAAVGRVRPGQRAQLRLTGFPATQYGVLPAVVSRVASEAQDGVIRVELAVRPGPRSRLPLQHGLPGTVEVEVERLTPAALVLRTVGKLLGRPVGAGS
ncbi:MAG: HlyD family secretion protein [Thermoanaerobaculia bacterium]